MADSELLAELKEQTRWLRFLGIGPLREVLNSSLKSDSHRQVYELSDGSRSVREIAAAAGVGPATVSRLWGLWSSLGIVVPSEAVQGRVRHLVSLSDLGLPVALEAGGADLEKNRQ